VVNHQYWLSQLLGTPPYFDTEWSEVRQTVEAMMASDGDAHRTAGHGALHGGFLAVFFVLPVIAIVAMFERRNWKYVMIHTGYWFFTLMAMGALICALF